MSFFAHHLSTIFAFKSIFVLDYYTWFLMGPMSYHPVLVVFPETGIFGNAVYVFFFAAFLYHMIQPTYWKRKVTRTLAIMSVAMLIPLAFLGGFNCMQDFDWEAE